MSNAQLSLPPLASLRAFEAVARSGSVKLASESLNLTPSAISHQIRTLEAHFGVQLVQRSGRGIALTESGAIYATAVLNAFSELFRAGDLLDDRKRGRIVRVSVTPTFAMLAALPHLEKFRVDNPGLDLRLEAKTRRSISKGTTSMPRFSSASLPSTVWPFIDCSIARRAVRRAEAVGTISSPSGLA